jgi:hypothetical protein
MSTKLKEFAAREHLRVVGHAKGSIFKHDLLAQAGVKPDDVFRVLVTDGKIVFEDPEPTDAPVIVPRPLSSACTLKERQMSYFGARGMVLCSPSPTGRTGHYYPYKM